MCCGVTAVVTSDILMLVRVTKNGAMLIQDAAGATVGENQQSGGEYPKHCTKLGQYA